MSNTQAIWHGYITTLVAGLAGALLFYALHLPLPWMLGSLFGAVFTPAVVGCRNNYFD